MDNNLVNLILKDELSWEYLILDVVKDENIDPEDIDIIQLTNAYVSRIRELGELNFILSGKVLLIAAILLRFKTRKLLESKDEEVAPNVDISVKALLNEIRLDEVNLEPNIPLPKTRKVTLEELMGALSSALTVEKRKKDRVQHRLELRARDNFKLRLRNFSLSDKVDELRARLSNFFKSLGKKFFLFSELRPSENKIDTVWTFLSLLHLSNNHVVELKQDKLFEDFRVEWLGDD